MCHFLCALSELELYLINESPQVTANSVEAEFEVNGPVTGIRCVLRSQVDRLWKDCKTSLEAECFSMLIISHAIRIMLQIYAVFESSALL